MSTHPLTLIQSQGISAGHEVVTRTDRARNVSCEYH
jgi:hypothetical protein